MKNEIQDKLSDHGVTLVLGGTGKTGRRFAERLEARNLNIRIGSRSAELPFDWNDASTWDAALDGRNAYVCDGVQRALGREPIDFADYARQVAASDVWKVAA